MRKFILALAALAVSTATCFAAFGIFQTYSVPALPQITCNLVTGVASVGGPCTTGATCDGVADTAPKFKEFNTWARANQGSNQVVLTIPAGTCLFNTAQAIPGTTLQNAWAAGVNNLIVEGTGATIKTGAAGFFLGGQGVIQIGLASASGQSARIQTASAGATTVTLTAASLGAGYVSRFTVGKTILIGGLDIQNLWNAPYGFPQNNHFFEWRQITNVNAGTGVITLDRPLTNTYLDTWPNYNSGNNFEVDAGGPATIYALNDTWNATIEYRGLTVDNPNQTYANVRNITYRNVTFLGGFGAIPTQNETFTAINCNWPSATVEVDKLVGTITITGSTVYRLDFQSSSVDRLVMSNTAITNSMFGSPKSSQLTDVTSPLMRPGAFAYGASTGSFVCTRCDVTDFQPTGGIAQSNDPSLLSKSAGVISFLNTDEVGPGPPGRVFVPNSLLMWTGRSGGSGVSTAGIFQAQTITQDATNVYIQTSEAGGKPGLDAPVNVRTHPAPQFTCDACTGDPELVAMNVQAGATPLAPMATYSSRSFNPSSVASIGNMLGRGKLVSLTVDVTTAFAGTGSPILNPTAQFHNFTINQSTWTTFDWFPTINLKQVGTRVITPGGVTCNGSPGGCAGDTINSTNGYPPNAVWVQDSISPWTGGSFTGMTVSPQFTITIRTDQTP